MEKLLKATKDSYSLFNCLNFDFKKIVPSYLTFDLSKYIRCVGLKCCRLLFANCVKVIFMSKRTWQPKRKKRLRVHGFLKRMATAGGKNVINRRRAKGRKLLTVTTGSK